MHRPRQPPLCQGSCSLGSWPLKSATGGEAQPTTSTPSDSFLNVLAFSCCCSALAPFQMTQRSLRWSSASALACSTRTSQATSRQRKAELVLKKCCQWQRWGGHSLVRASSSVARPQNDCVNMTNSLGLAQHPIPVNGLAKPAQCLAAKHIVVRPSKLGA